MSCNTNDTPLTEQLNKTDDISSLNLKDVPNIKLPSCTPPVRIIYNSKLNISNIDIFNCFNRCTLGDPIEMYKNIINLHLSKSTEKKLIKFLDEIVTTQSGIPQDCNNKWLHEFYNVVIGIAMYILTYDKVNNKDILDKISEFWIDCCKYLPTITTDESLPC